MNRRVRSCSRLLAGIVLMLAAVGTMAQDRPRNCIFFCDRGTNATPSDFSFFAGLAFAWDSNIDRNQDELEDWGVIPVFGVEWVKELGTQKLELSYEGASHHYDETDQWDRYSQRVNGLWEVNWSKHWRSQTLMDLTFKGSSEDRELADRYSIIERLDYEITKHLEGRLYGAWRVRANNEDPGRDGDNPYAGVVLTREIAKHHEISVEYRWEDYRAEAPRNRYKREGYAIEYEGELGDSDDLSVEFKYRDQYYHERLIEVDDELVYRQDDRYFATLLWTHRFGPHWEWWFTYEFEQRNSNDPDKEYDGHYLGTAVLYRW